MAGRSGRPKNTQKVKVRQAPTLTQTIIRRDGHKTHVRTKYSPDVHKKVIESVKMGRSLTDSGILAGLGRDTLWGWLDQGRKQPDIYPEYAQLVQDIEEAQASRRAEAVDNIVTVGNSQQAGTWQANAWFLERTDPENWGRKDKVEHVGNDTPKTQINTVVLIDSGARESARDLLSRVAGHSGPDLAVGPGGSVQLEDGDS